MERQLAHRVHTVPGLYVARAHARLRAVWEACSFERRHKSTPPRQAGRQTRQHGAWRSGGVGLRVGLVIPALGKERRGKQLSEE